MILFIISGPLGTLLVFFGSLFIGTGISVVSYLKLEPVSQGGGDTHCSIFFLLGGEYTDFVGEYTNFDGKYTCFLFFFQRCTHMVLYSFSS